MNSVITFPNDVIIGAKAQVQFAKIVVLSITNKTNRIKDSNYTN